MSNESFPNIPNYQVESEIARGGMAVVYKGKHTTLDRTVAVKLLKADMIENQFAANRFIKEPKILAQFSHPNIVAIYDSGFTDQEQLYLAMEYLPGGTLKGKMQQAKLPLDQIISIIKSVSGALDLAHSKGFVHRDIKPDNILFRENGEPVLTDFGIAKDLDSNTHATTAGTLLGTYRYMSPEQFQGLEPDGRSDFYSLGIMLVELLTGERPYDGTSVEAMITKRLTEAVPELPEDFIAFQPVVEKMLARDRELRFATAAELIQALQGLEFKLGFIEPDPTVVIEATPQASKLFHPLRSQPNRVWMFTGVAAAVIAGVAIFVIPAIQDSFKIKELHAAISKEVITIEQSIAQLKQNDANYPQELNNVESLLEELKQSREQVQQELATLEGEHDKVMQGLEQEKAELKEKLQEQESVNEQAQAGFTKELMNEEANVTALRDQLALLEQKTANELSDYQQRSQQLDEQKQDLQQQVAAEESNLTELRQKNQQALSDEEKQLIELRKQLISTQEQYRLELAALSQEDTDVAGELEKLNKQLVQEQEQFDAKRVELSQIIVETQQKLEQSQQSANKLSKDFEVLKQDDKDLIEVKQQEFKGVTSILAKLQKDIEPLAEKYGDVLSSKDEERIKKLLQKAKSAFKKKNFTTPRNDNVTKWAEEIFKIDPDNEQAKAVIGRAIDTYLGWVWLKEANSLSKYFTAEQRSYAMSGLKKLSQQRTKHSEKTST